MVPKCSVSHGSMKCSTTAVDRQTIETPLKYIHTSLYLSLQNGFYLCILKGFQRRAIPVISSTQNRTVRHRSCRCLELVVLIDQKLGLPPWSRALSSGIPCLCPQRWTKHQPEHVNTCLVPFKYQNSDSSQSVIFYGTETPSSSYCMQCDYNMKQNLPQIQWKLRYKNMEQLAQSDTTYQHQSWKANTYFLSDSPVPLLIGDCAISLSSGNVDSPTGESLQSLVFSTFTPARLKF